MESKIMLRILKEIQEINEGDAELKDQIYLQAVDDSDIRKLRGFIRGPPDTPYENGIFNLSITLPDEYPFKPPMVKFVTKIYHPNIRSTGGYICLDVLSQAWTPTMTLKTMLLSLQLLLQDPKPDDPLEHTIAIQLRTDRAAFNKTAFFWTGEYALTPDERTDEWKQMNVMVMREMKRRRTGRVRAMNLLSRSGWQESTRKRRGEESVREDDEDEVSTAPRRARTESPAYPINPEEEVEIEVEEDSSDEELTEEEMRMIISMSLSGRGGLHIGSMEEDDDDDN